MTGPSATSPLAADLRALAAGATLPATCYTDPAIFAREGERIFRRAWQYVALAEDLPGPNTFLTAQAGDLPLVLTRDAAGDLHAFVNVCRHRGAQVAWEPCGERATLQCPYHAWTYNLDGSLRAAPAMRDEAAFDPSAYPLFALPVETWGPFIFVNPDPAAPPLRTILAELPDLVAQTGLRLDSLKRRVRQVYDIQANWKVIIDNYLECYHCPVAHPGFTQLIDLAAYTVAEYDWFSTQGGPLKRPDRPADALYDTGGGVADGFYAYLWPNFTLNVYPGPGNVSLNLFLPLAPDRTRAIFEYCFVDEVSAADEADFVRFIEQVQVEDIALCESVQRGLATGYFDRGRLMAQEQALAHFQRLICRELGETSGD